LELPISEPALKEPNKFNHPLVRDHRHHRIFSLEGPLHLVCKLMQCTDTVCPNHHRTFGPERELTLTMPWWLIGWDVFCWLGHRRFARHWIICNVANAC